jgi:hypothetical protein
MPFTRTTGWSVADISPERIQTRFLPPNVSAWLAKIERI